MPASEGNGVSGVTPPKEGAGDDPALAVLGALVASNAMGTSYVSLRESLKAAVRQDPFDATIVTVLGGSFLFYIAEKGHNPKVETYWDALVFISTCLSVGYADIFARTPAGQAIASAVMTLGPAMSGAIFEGPPAEEDKKKAAPEELYRVQAAIVDKLDAILQELRAARRGTPGAEGT
jgi:voltage-gated potassium channel